MADISALELDPSDSSTMLASSESTEFVTAPAPEQATTSSSAYFSTHSEGKRKSCAESEECSNSIGDQIKRSQCHWSETVTLDYFKEEEASDNEEVFKALQLHPRWGEFFWPLNQFGGLEVGEKFAEGGQAELYEVQITWYDPKDNEIQRERGDKWVLKVFKRGRCCATCNPSGRKECFSSMPTERDMKLFRMPQGTFVI